MSASQKVSASSQIRAATYNVSKGSRRRVKWLAAQEQEQRGTNADDIQDSSYALPSDTSITEDNLKTQAFSENKLVTVEKCTQQGKPILPVSYLSSIPVSTDLHDNREQSEYKVTPESYSQLDNASTMSSTDTKSSSESLDTLKKENTFIVTDKTTNSEQINSAEVLRRRKAMALAKANARHAIKNWHARYFYHNANENKKDTNTRNRIRSNQPSVRAYIENLGSEVRNDRGEKIYFRWEERDNSALTSFTRVPQGVRKLQEYKKKRLKKNKYNTGSSKSAPNKKPDEGNFSPEQPDNTKRSKTADVVSNDQEPISNNSSILRRGLASFNKTKVRTKVAFTIPRNQSSKNKIVDVKNENQQIVIVKEKVKDQQIQPNINEDTNSESVDGCCLDVNKNIHKFTRRDGNDTGNSSDNFISDIKPVHTDRHVEASSTQFVPISSIVHYHISSTTDHRNNASKQHWKSNYNLVPRTEPTIDHSQQEVQKQDDTQIDINIQSKNNNTSNTTSEVAGNVLESNSFIHTDVIKQTQSQYDTNSGQVTSVEKTKHINSKATTGCQLHSLNNDGGDKNLLFRQQDRHHLNRNSSTKITDNSIDTSQPSNKITDIMNREITKQNNDYILNDYGSSIECSVPNVSNRTSILPAVEKREENIQGDHKQELEHNIRTIDNKTNIISNSDNSIKRRSAKKDFDIKTIQEDKCMFNGIEKRKENCIPNKKGVNSCYGDRVKITSKENKLRCDEKNISKTHDSNCEESNFSNRVNEILNDSSEQKQGIHTDDNIKNKDSKKINNKIRTRRRESELKGEFHETLRNSSTENGTAKLCCVEDDDTSKSNVHVVTKTESETRDVDTKIVQHSDQTRDAGIVSNTSIDHSSVYRSGMSGSDDMVYDRAIQHERVSSGQGEHCCVTELKHGNGVELNQGRGRSLQDIGVSTATQKVNKCITTADGNRKQALHIKDSLSSMTGSRNNWSSKKNGACHNELKDNELSQPACDTEKDNFDKWESNFSSQPPGDKTSNIFVIRNSSPAEVPCKQVYNVRHNRQSITNGATKEMLNLDLVELEKHDELTASTLSISRYKNGSDLPQGESHLHNDQQQKRNRTGYDVLPNQSKTITNFVRNKKSNTKGIECQEKHSHIQPANSRSRNRIALNVVGTANRMSKIHDESVNSDIRDNSSRSNHKSINEARIVSETISVSEISDGDSSCSNILNKSGEVTSADKITDEISIQDRYHGSQSLLSNVIATGDVKKSLRNKNNVTIPGIDSGGDIRSTNKQTYKDIALKGEHAEWIDHSKNMEYFNSQHQEIYGYKDKKSYQGSQTRTREHERKRQALSIHTQNMEFTETPKKKDIQLNSNTVPQTQIYKLKEVKGIKNSPALKETDVRDSNVCDISQRNGMNYSEEIIQTGLRPKTAGLSDYSKHQSEELWSVNTDDDGDDDDDDQIQFIEGEQDFFKVFGYNEETVAILNSTKVYPVPASIDATFGFQDNYFLSAPTEQEFYNSNFDNRHLSNGDTIPGVDNDKVIDYGDDVSKSKGIHEKYEVQKKDNIQMRIDQKKLTKISNNFASKQFDKQEIDFSQKTYKTDNGQLNVYRQKKSNDSGTTVARVSNDHQNIIKQTSTFNGFSKDGKNVEFPSKHEENGSSFLQNPNQTIRRLDSKPTANEVVVFKPHQDFGETLSKELYFQDSNLLHSHYQPLTETLTLLGNPRESNGHTTRRRIHSEADILTTSMDGSQTLPDSECHSDGNLKIPSGSAMPIQDVLTILNKDSKSHVAIRNQIATERHINQNRYHRNVSNNFPKYQKSSVLQISAINEPRNFKSKDKTDFRQLKNMDPTRQTHLRGLESSLQPEQTSTNTYLQAADRIMSRIADTEKSIYTRMEPNSTAAQKTFQNTSRDENINSPLRRMSHPVDSRIKHSSNANSYFVSRPRKLEPILQVPEQRNQIRK